MTLEWRQLALSNLLKAQEKSGLNLIAPEEISQIRKEWSKDDKE
jgi:hypothetical protein